MERLCFFLNLSTHSQTDYLRRLVVVLLLLLQALTVQRKALKPKKKVKKYKIDITRFYYQPKSLSSNPVKPISPHKERFFIFYKLIYLRFFLWYNFLKDTLLFAKALNRAETSAKRPIYHRNGITYEKISF